LLAEERDARVRGFLAQRLRCLGGGLAAADDDEVLAHARPGGQSPRFYPAAACAACDFRPLRRDTALGPDPVPALASCSRRTPVPKHIHEARFDCAMTTLFAAAVLAAARGRWDTQALAERGVPVPSAGCAYARARGTVLRRGRVVEVLRPVGLTLQESLLDPPCCVRLRLRWRLEPLEE